MKTPQKVVVPVGDQEIESPLNFDVYDGNRTCSGVLTYGFPVAVNVAAYLVDKWWNLYVKQGPANMAEWRDVKENTRF
jgi:hypothetical protein